VRLRGKFAREWWRIEQGGDDGVKEAAGE